MDTIAYRFLVRQVRMNVPGEKLESWYADQVQPHGADLLGWLRRRFPSLRDPENIAQESLVRVMRAHQSHQDVLTPRALLFATARNLAIDELRRHQVIPMDGLAEMDELPVSSSVPDAAGAATLNEELAILRLAIQSLPTRCRQVLTLRKIYGLSHRQIADQLGIAPHTVEAQISNGMRRCAEFLARHGLP